ncbi:MAG: PBSX family phage terminase large subunit [Candidatus Bathyarchaeota archaeon]|jgi:phage terminase large subunit
MSAFEIPEKLLPLLEKKKRFKIVIGGRGSAKSTTIGKIMLMKAETEAADILCLREFQSSIEDSVHKLISSQVEELGVQDRFYVTDKKVECVANGKGTRYKGAARNPAGIKSAEGYKYAWFEEAQTISDETLKLLIPTIREKDSELWFTANPGSANDAFSKRFIVPFIGELDNSGYYEDDLHLIIVINWRDNPWFPKELEADRRWDYENLSRAEYDHIWEGKFYDSIEDAIIQPEWFDACINAHVKLGIKPSGVEVVAHDPSDTGPDAKGLAYRHGIVIKDIQEMDKGDINTGGDWAIGYAASHKVDAFIWDCDGMGVGLNRQVEQGLTTKNISIEMYKGSQSPRYPDAIYEKIGGKNKTNSETFANQRAQGYWMLRERMRRTYLAIIKGEYQDPDSLISINGGLDNIGALRSELCRIPKAPNGAGKIQLMKKEDMKKKGIKSPNLADSVMMAMFYEPKTEEVEEYHAPIPTTSRW